MRPVERALHLNFPVMHGKREGETLKRGCQLDANVGSSAFLSVLMPPTFEQYLNPPYYYCGSTMLILPCHKQRSAFLTINARDMLKKDRSGSSTWSMTKNEHGQICLS